MFYRKGVSIKCCCLRQKVSSREISDVCVGSECVALVALCSSSFHDSQYHLLRLVSNIYNEILIFKT